MASAGRILIMPKGNWSAETEYEMLDLVYHNGTSWLAKKDVVGVEPSEANSEYWHNLLDFSKNDYASKIVSSQKNNTVDPNITTLSRIRTVHENCPKSDKEYVVDTIFVDGVGEIYEKHQYARGRDDVFYTRYKGYNGEWTKWEMIARGRVFNFAYNPMGGDYIEYKIPVDNVINASVVANTVDSLEVYVTGVYIRKYEDDGVTVRIKLNKSIDAVLHFTVGILH